MSQKIGFVGVGRMGANMARHLHEVGYTISAVFDVRAASADEVAGETGAKACTTLAEVTALSDVIITVVTDDKAMLNIFGNAADNLLMGAKGRVFINCATISRPRMSPWRSSPKKAKARTLEGCMASSITQAREGSLYLMCGGERAVFDEVLPILQKLAKDLRYVGKTGQAAQVKALVNMVMTRTRRPWRRARTGLRPEARPEDAHGGLQPDRRELTRPRDGWRGYDEPRSQRFLQRSACGEG
jgi:3-hydroxyisobutyrate dehydrogenase